MGASLGNGNEIGEYYNYSILYLIIIGKNNLLI